MYRRRGHALASLHLLVASSLPGEAMLLEQFNHQWSQHNTPPALLRFRLRFDVPVTRSAREDAPNL